MTDQPLSEPVREILSDHVESVAESGDFDAMWNRRQSPARRSSWPNLALAAAALLVIGIATKQAAETLRPGSSMEASAPWVEPFALRFPVQPPSAGAREKVRAMMEDPSDDSLYEAALALTPPKDHSQLALRRALAAHHDADLDGVLEWGQKSGTATGKLMAAEVHIVDLEPDSALMLFREVQRSTDSTAAPIAKQYLNLLTAGPPVLQGIAELRALILLNDGQSACKHLPEMWPDLGPKELSLVRDNAPELERCRPGDFPSP